MAIAGKKGRVYGATATTSTAFTNEAMTANVDRTQYTITNAARRYLDINTVTTFQSSPNGTDWTPIVPAEIQYAGSVAVFSPGLAVGTQVRAATGSFFPVAPLADFTKWKMDVEVDIEDVTALGDDWKKYAAITGGFKGSMEKFRADTYFFDRIVADLPVLLILYVDLASTYRYEGYGWLSKNGLEAASKGMQMESIDFSGEGEIYPRGY